jgi:hypothetical protein
MITKLHVTYNDTEIPIQILVDYAKLYSPVELEEYLYIKSTDCEVVLTPSNDFEAISFANGVCTSLGGTHVDAWCEAIFRPLLSKVNKKGKPQVAWEPSTLATYSPADTSSPTQLASNILAAHTSDIKKLFDTVDALNAKINKQAAYAITLDQIRALLREELRPAV